MDIIEEQFSLVIHEFFTSSFLLKQVNHTTLLLVSKSHHIETVEDYRPISYYNVFYKVISKVRLAIVLNSIID